MLYITGDTHIPSDIQKLSTKRFPQQKKLSNDDYVIICGDFGGIWDNSSEEKYWIKWLEGKNFTTLFIDGNHENFDFLNEYEVISFNGGTVRRVSDKIYHLMRGQIYTLCGKKIFTMGGAESHDKEHRTEHKTWWSDEMPLQSEYEQARKNLAAHNNSVDIVITHCAPTSIQKTLTPEYPQNELTDFFDDVTATVLYDKWFFGHYHIDRLLDNKHIAVFNEIINVHEILNRV